MLSAEQRLATRAIVLRLAVETAIHRIGMWQASHNLDHADDAEQVLEQVRRMLMCIPPPAKATNHDGYHRGGCRPALPGPREGEAR